MVVVECRATAEVLEVGIVDVELDGADGKDDEDTLDDDDDGVFVPVVPGSEA